MYHNAVNRLQLPADIATEMINWAGATGGGGGGGGGGGKHASGRGFMGRSTPSAARKDSDDEEPIPPASAFEGRAPSGVASWLWTTYAAPAALAVVALAVWGAVRAGRQRRSVDLSAAAPLCACTAMLSSRRAHDPTRVCFCPPLTLPGVLPRRYAKYRPVVGEVMD